MKLHLFLPLLALFTLLFSPLSAQTEKGKYVVSARSALDFAYSENRIKSENGGFNNNSSFDTDQFSLNLSAGLGYFVIDNLSVGAGISYALSDGDYQYKTSSFSFMPTGTYYFCPGKVVRPTVSAGLGYVRLNQEVDTNSGAIDRMSFNGFTWGLGLGAAFFIHDNISIDLSLEYLEIHSSYSDDSSIKLKTNGLGGSIGLSVYF